MLVNVLQRAGNHPFEERRNMERAEDTTGRAYCIRAETPSRGCVEHGGCAVRPSNRKTPTCKELILKFQRFTQGEEAVQSIEIVELGYNQRVFHVY